MMGFKHGNRPISSREVYQEWQFPCDEVSLFLGGARQKDNCEEGLDRLGWHRPRLRSIVGRKSREIFGTAELDVIFIAPIFEPFKTTADPWCRTRYWAVGSGAKSADLEITPDFTAEQRWIEENRVRFAGKWVALFGNRLVASGDSAKLVYQRARALGYTRPLVVHFPPSNELPFGGW